jgi:surface protein
MSNLFYWCFALENVKGLSTLKTQEVTDMSLMFGDCHNIKLETNDLISFDTSKVKNMHYMFGYCKNNLTDLDLSTLDTSSLTDMSEMFHGCAKLTSINLGGTFDTSNVTNMGSLFDGCTSLTSVIMTNGGSKNATVTNMFYGITTTGTFNYSSKYNYSKIIGTDGVLPTTWTSNDIKD